MENLQENDCRRDECDPQGQRATDWVRTSEPSPSPTLGDVKKESSDVRKRHAYNITGRSSSSCRRRHFPHGARHAVCNHGNWQKGRKSAATESLEQDNIILL